MNNPLLEGLEKTILELIPDASTKTSIFNKSKFAPKPGYKMKGPFRESGIAYFDGKCEFWFELNQENICRIEISRDSLPLTRLEKTIIGLFPSTIVGLLFPDSERRHELTLKIASRIGFEYAFISSYLRGGHSATFWSPAFILLQLQELTYLTYEKEPCTSGFIFSSQSRLYISRIKQPDYSITLFDNKIRVSNEHFAKPAAYRYIDGKNSFYLIDNFLNIHGIIKVRDPNSFSRIDRSNFTHILPLVDGMPGRPWAAFVGNNRSLIALVGRRAHFVWQKNHWHLIESAILHDLLKDFGCADEIASMLSSVILTMSDLRKGCVLLISNDNTKLPDVIGSIDDSAVATAIRKSLISAKIKDLVKDQSILGVLSSDGLTTFSIDGDIIRCGDIIDISKACDSSVAGGGRTQATIAASYFGLSIKVSEDGPISVYKNGNKIIRLVS